MKNPESITFTGAATGEYDGSSPLTVNIPTLSAANETTLGGVKAAAKTAGDTVPAKIGSDNILYVSTYPTELPASDVHDWAKAENKPSYTPTEVGVIGTAPTDGEVAVFDGTTGKIKSTGFTIEKSVPADAEFTDTTYGVMGGASTSEAGTEGLVPAPEAGNHNSYLRGDGTWAVLTDTTYDVMTGASADAAGESGLVPTPEAGAQNKFLRGDGTWQTHTDTTYGAAGTELGLVKTGGDVTITDGVITINDDSHNHTIDNVDGLQDALDGKLGKTETAAAATKLATARKITVDGDATGEVTFDGSANKTITVTINKLKQRQVTIPSGGWSISYPYTNTVSVSGLSADSDLKIVGVYLETDATEDEVKAANKAAGYLIYNESGVADGEITFKAYKKPTVNFTVITEGG